MRARTALAALLGVASFGVAAWGQAPVTNVAGTSTVFQDAGCGCGVVPEAASCSTGCNTNTSRFPSLRDALI